ncbi:DUF1905 domain-containing protein [Pedobacter sp. BS3]|uniref:YdeI/OmpD-associated family protein n=1 Tax=Pedobacter sp. BS3 TaxID=2567937 RepID=UPI0011EFEB02|nr:YdeI/OmpD-associated family protein [Pedobacter sp. BS3]TZF81712.1 DUF1905 domain-containing protein [Pedobacter sp. BS3]
MVSFTALILQFAEQGEKTGWTYIEIPAHIAAELLPGNKKSFRVKGTLDNHPIRQVALMPMGEGNFIMAINATMRKGIRKGKGATLAVSLEVDTSEIEISPELLECLKYEPEALDFFNSLTKGHRNYFSKWIESAKTEATRANRIAKAVNALAKGWSFPEMMRAAKAQKQ